MTKSNDLINKVVNFYQQYLDCSSEQLDLLALWTMHTHILPAAPFSPALNICSRQKHSGKTVCLQLLSLLCDGAHMHTAAAPSLLLHKLTDHDEPFPGTLLLDDCDATFGKTRMNIKLQGLFTARFQQDARFTVRVKDDGEYVFDDRLVFFPAAFAGNGRLHPALAERSIQIALDLKKPGSTCQPFRFYAAQHQARPLYFDLSDWGNGNHERFEKIAPYKEDQFPPELSWRNRDCAEPLLHVADFIGGDWPQRARQALVNAFALAAFEDFYSSKQILSDIRDAFAEKGNPEWLSSAHLLSFLHNRTWDTWTKDKPMQPKALARLLEPFGIRPRNHRTGPDNVPKGYYREDLEPVWTKHLPALTCGTEPAQRCESKGAMVHTTTPVAAKLQDLAFSNPATSIQKKEEASSAVAANPQSLSSSTPKLAASSQKLVASPVAAKMQDLAPSKPVTSNQPKDAVLSSQANEAVLSPVAGVLQNSPPSNPKQAASSQKPGASSVAAKMQDLAFSNPATGIKKKEAAPNAVAADSQNLSSSTPKLTASSQKLAATPVAANLQNSIPQNPRLAAGSQKLVAPSSQKPGANSAVTGAKPTIGQRIMASSRPSPGRRHENGLLLDPNL